MASADQNHKQLGLLTDVNLKLSVNRNINQDELQTVWHWNDSLRIKTAEVPRSLSTEPMGNEAHDVITATVDT